MNINELFAEQFADSLPYNDLPTLPEDIAGHSWSSNASGFVCEECVNIPELVRVVPANAEDEDSCEYCEATARNAHLVSLSHLIDYLYRCLYTEYDHPEETDIHVPMEVRELFGAEPMSTTELMESLDEPVGSEQLADEIERSIDREWVEQDGLHDRFGIRILKSWEEFSQEIQEGPRFLFSRDRRRLSGHSLEDVLRYLDTVASHLQTEFVQQLEPGRQLVRAREQTDNRTFTTADDLGSPPPNKAQAQRLSAAGVSCFYAAEDAATAIAEIRADPASIVAVGQWVTTRPFSYIDLTLQRPLPSFFDLHGARLRQFMPFLKGFQRAISRPKDDSVGDANSYLASQVFGEYIRYSLPTAARQGVEAVCYPSTANGGGVNWCFFGRLDQGEPPGISFAGHEIKVAVGEV